MQNIQIGDIVKGLPGSPSGIINKKMTRGVVTQTMDSLARVAVLEYENNCSDAFTVDVKHLEVIGHVKPWNREDALSMLASGNNKALLEFDLTNANLKYADLTNANLKYADLANADLRYANLTNANLTNANLRYANLTKANLRGANIDFSCWPLWCGSLRGVKTDVRQAAQIAYHLCCLECEDEEYMAMRNSIIGFANKFHRVGESGIPNLEVNEE